MTDTRALYLDLIERVIINRIYEDPPTGRSWRKRYFFRPEWRDIGRDQPSVAHSMIGAARMANLRMLLEDAIRRDIPGDFIETGVWRGGACIYARAIFKAWGQDRRVWVADSFQGLPKPDARYVWDRGDKHHKNPVLAISRAAVEENFRKYDLLDDQVAFLEGWFKDTLPTAPIERLAVLRLDGDMYQSTMDALMALYDRVSPGGHVIVDDHGAVEGCAKAVEDFLAARGEKVVFHKIDWTGVYWTKG